MTRQKSDLSSWQKCVRLEYVTLADYKEFRPSINKEFCPIKGSATYLTSINCRSQLRNFSLNLQVSGRVSVNWDKITTVPIYVNFMQYNFSFKSQNPLHVPVSNLLLLGYKVQRYDFAKLFLKYGSEEKGSSLYRCSILLGFIMSKKQERLRSELLSEDKITNLLGFST